MAIWNERIRQKRVEKGLTLAYIADLLGVTEATAQRYESGSIKSVPYEHMCAYGEILNCSPAYLMGWEEKSSLYNTEKECQMGELFSSLNDRGQDKAIEQVELLTRIPDYQSYTPASTTSRVCEKVTTFPQPEDLLTEAAHDRTDIEYTDEDRKLDDEMLD